MNAQRVCCDIAALGTIVASALNYAPQIAAVFATLYYITLILKEWRK